MALGGNYNSNQNNNNNQNNDPTYYSRFRISNYNENLALGCSFWKGTLKLYIQKFGENNKAEEVGSIYFSPNKARLFANCVQKIIDDPDTFDIFGVDTGSGEIRGMAAIGRDMGKPYIALAKVDGSGKYTQYQRFNFPYDYNYSLKIENLTNLQFSKEINNTVDLETLKDLLYDYARASSGAYGASYYDIGRYEAGRESNLMKKVAIKLGVLNQDGSYADGTGYHRSNSNNSFFSGNGNSNTNNKSEKSYQTIDDLEDELG